jgi:hypothetical protein
MRELRQVARGLAACGDARGITLDVDSQEFEEAQHADDLQAKLTASFGGIL